MATKKTTLVLDTVTARHLRVYAFKQDRTMSDVTQEALHNFFNLSCPKWQTDYIIMEDEQKKKPIG